MENQMALELMYLKVEIYLIIMKELSKKDYLMEEEFYLTLMGINMKENFCNNVEMVQENYFITMDLCTIYYYYYLRYEG